MLREQASGLNWFAVRPSTLSISIVQIIFQRSNHNHKISYLQQKNTIKFYPNLKNTGKSNGGKNYKFETVV
jgi:hypothetical protein